MINFRLFGYPIQIQWMFWLMCAILGMGAMSEGGREGIIKLAIWVGVVLVSILWHEFGHALARKKFRAPYSEIVLHGFGGYCTGPGNFTRKEHMFVAFAGPLASFILGGLICVLALSPIATSHWSISYLIVQARWVNIGWAILNLLPIYPLDGGQIFAAYMANKKPSIVPVVGMVTAIAVAVFGAIKWNSLWMVILFGLLAYQNWQRSKGMSPTRFL